MTDTTFRAKFRHVAGVCSLAVLLVSCGGGASSGACTNVDPGRDPNLPGCTAVAPAPAPAPTTASQVAFVSALPQNLALIGTGGPGRQETSTLTFKLLSSAGVPVPGVTVDFTLFGLPAGTATGGITLTPANAVSGADGIVVTVVAAGSVNTPVRVLATARGYLPVVSAVSDELVVSTGIPDQNGMSLSTEILNLEGGSHDGCVAPVGSKIRVSLSDHFRNPVPDGTAVSFTAEGGVIEASCRTGLVSSITNGVESFVKGVPGVCTVKFCAAAPRSADGRITIMAYALGEESYEENSALPFSINRYDLGENFDDLCEPFRDDAAVLFPNSTLKDSRVSACRAPASNEMYIDTNGDGRFNAIGDRIYNGVLNVDPATGKTIANNRSPTVHIRKSLIQVLSTSDAAINLYVAGNPVDGTLQLPTCTDGVAFANPSVALSVAVRDQNRAIFEGNSLPGNILPAGTRITITTNNGTINSGIVDYTVPNTISTNQGNWIYQLAIRSDAVQGLAAAGSLCTNASRTGVLTIRAETPMGVVSTASYTVTD